MDQIHVVFSTFCCLTVLSAQELCLRGDFQEQFQFILQKEVMSDEDIAETTHILSDLTETANKKLPGAVITPYGSLATGLAMKSSDIDFYLTLPSYDNTNGNTTNIFLNLLDQQPDLYREVFPRLVRVPVVTALHVPSQKYFDLTFKDFSATVNLLKYFISSDPRIRELILFLKVWRQSHRLGGFGKLRSFALYLMAVFYFQQKQMLPPVFQMQKNAKPVILHGYNQGYNMIPIHSPNNESIYELLGGFFRYYREFDFDDYIISPFVGKPVSKRLFSDVATIPTEFALYKQKLLEGTTEPMNCDVRLIVQEAFEHDENLTRGNETFFERVIFHIIRAANIFDTTPPNMLLSTLLEADQDIVQSDDLTVLGNIYTNSC